MRVILALILVYYLGAAERFGLSIQPKAIRVARIAALSVILLVVVLAAIVATGLAARARHQL